MNRSGGFSIIEVMIVIIIMGILTTLGVINMSKQQMDARNVERKADIETIARGLENRYKTGNPRITSNQLPYVTAGGYPSINEILHILGRTSLQDLNDTEIPLVPGGYVSEALPGTKRAMFIPPGANQDYFSFWMCQPNSGCLSSVKDDSVLEYVFRQNKNTYYYEPLDSGGNICFDTLCRSFKLSWVEEHRTSAFDYRDIKSIESKHQ